MKRSLYGERDYAFGERILTLRTQIGLTQTGLAQRLGVSRRAVAEWEAGSSYPKPEHLQALIALGVQASAFPLSVRPRRSARCGGRPTRRCCSMRPGSPDCSAARILR